MLTAEAQIETERPSRYLVQLCRHAAAMGGTRGHRLRVHAGNGTMAGSDVRVSAEWSESRGVVRFDPWGQCAIEASADTLTLRVEATDEEDLRQIQDVLTRDLGRFGRRERLAVNWGRSEARGVQAGGGPAA